MRCPRCQHENEAGAKFCEECAAPLARACAQCGRQLSPTAKFCAECAHPTGPSAAPPPAPRFDPPEAYTPKHLTEKVLTSKSALEGERKQVTVLFADLKGSMELLAERDPEEAREILDPVLERMMEAVHRYEGTVNQVMGDGIMALFGAPVAHEDHAVRACYAAQRIQDSVTRYAEEARGRYGVNVQVRVGINSGEVVVRAIGSDLHMDYTAVGQTAHLAGRMEQLAGPGSILLTPATLKLVEGFVAVRPLGPVPVKGLTDPVEVYEATGAGPARTRWQAVARRGLTRFVGRDAEVDQLGHALERAAAGHGQVVAVVGEVGVGKSRLIYEFTHSHRVRGWSILTSGSAPYGKAIAYLPVIDLLKEYFKIQDGDDQGQIRDKVIGRVRVLDRSLEPLLPPILALLDPVGHPGWAALDLPQRRQRTLEAVTRLLLRESQAQPLLVVCEDLHWIDSETQALLDELVESLSDAPLLLLVNYRPEYRHPWAHRRLYTQLRLDPLPRETAARLLGALLGSDTALDPLKGLLIARTEGNPFFLEESVRELVETGALLGERGAYRLARPLPAIQVPATVQAVLAARIDRLSPEDKALVQAASVVGKHVPFALLQAICALSRDELHAAIGRLQAAEFLYEARIFPALEYSFKHALTQDVAYGSLLLDQRRSLHGQIVEAMERLYSGDRRAEHVEQLAHHAVQGELWEKAVLYLRQNGAKAANRSALPEAAQFFEQALAALDRLPESREKQEQRIDLCFDLRASLLPLGELRRIHGRLREAERHAEALNDAERLGWAASHMAAYCWLTGAADRAIESGRRALAIAKERGHLPMRVATHVRLGQVYQTVGQYGEAAEMLRWNVKALAGEPPSEHFGLPYSAAVCSRSWLTWCLAETGGFVEGIALGEEGIAIGEALDRPFGLIDIYAGVGHLYCRKGAPERAIPILERGLGICRSRDAPIWTAWVLVSAGYAYALTGRFRDATPLLEAAMETAESIGLLGRAALWLGLLGEAHLLVGHGDAAHRSASRALVLSRERGERGHEAWAWRLLGEIASLRHPPEPREGRASYRHALALGTGLGMRPLVAHCHLGLGRLCRRGGEREQAREHLATAAAMYREMDMGFHLEQAEAEVRSGP